MITNVVLKAAGLLTTLSGLCAVGVMVSPILRASAGESLVTEAATPTTAVFACEGCDKRLNGTGGVLYNEVIADVPSGQIHVREKISGYKQTCTQASLTTPCETRTCTFKWELEAWGTGGMGSQPYDTLTVDETTPPSTPVTHDLPEGVNNRITVLGPITQKGVPCGYSTRRTGTFFNPTHMLVPFPYDFRIGCHPCLQ